MRKKIISVMLICAGFPVGSLYAVHPAPVTRIQSVQQNGACTGVVKDASGEAVIGASVTVDGTTMEQLPIWTVISAFPMCLKEVLSKFLL